MAIDAISAAGSKAAVVPTPPTLVRPSHPGGVPQVEVKKLGNTPDIVQISAKAKHLYKARKLLQSPTLPSSQKVPRSGEMSAARLSAQATAQKDGNTLNARIQRGESTLSNFKDRPLLEKARALSGMKIQAMAEKVKQADGLGAKIARSETVLDARRLGRLEPELYRRLGQSIVERARAA